MKNDEKASILLEHLDEVVQINFFLEKHYKKALVKGLTESEGKSTGAKAKMILERFDEAYQVNWGFEKFYLKAIVKGLNKIDELEKKELKKAEG